MTPDNVIVVLLLNCIQSWPLASVIIASMIIKMMKSAP